MELYLVAMWVMNFYHFRREVQSAMTQKYSVRASKTRVQSEPLVFSFSFLQISPDQKPSFPNPATSPTSLLFRFQTDLTHQFSLGSPMAIMELIFLGFCFTLSHNSAAWQWRLQRRQNFSRIYTQLRKNKRSRSKAGDWLGQGLLSV